MPAETVTLEIPEVMLHALQVGSPPAWDDVPEEFQADIAALDKLDDNTLWQIVRSQKTAADIERYNILLEGNSNGTLTEAERLELAALRRETDLFMLRKAHAAVLLRWRGHNMPTP